MRLERSRDPAGPIVLGLGPAGFRTADGTYAALLMTVEAAAGWTPPPFATLDAAAIAPVLTPAPEFLLLGTGSALVLPPRAFVTAMEAAGIGVEAMDSRAAARAWGVLRGEVRRIAAALYPLG